MNQNSIQINDPHRFIKQVRKEWPSLQETILHLCYFIYNHFECSYLLKILFWHSNPTCVNTILLEIFARIYAISIIFTRWATTICFCNHWWYVGHFLIIMLDSSTKYVFGFWIAFLSTLLVLVFDLITNYFHFQAYK